MFRTSPIPRTKAAKLLYKKKRPQPAAEVFLYENIRIGETCPSMRIFRYRTILLFFGVDEHIVDAADSFREVALAYTDDNIKLA